MLKSFKYRISPKAEQPILLNKHIGSARFIYNLALETKQMAYAGNRISLSCFDLMNQLPGLKKECKWLQEINSQTLQQSIRNLDNAFTRFFKGQGDFPKFKKKKSAGSFNIPQGISIKNNKIFIPKFREGINIIMHRPIKGEIKQATISKKASGKYFVSILCETGIEINAKKTISENNTIGIDLGIKSFIVTSNGKKYNNPQFLKKSLGKLKYLQNRFSKYKGKNTKEKLINLHEKVGNQRNDFLHKISSELINNHDCIAIENLQIVNMLKSHNLAQCISDAGWGKFVDFLKYKANWNGVNILEIGTFDPSSKTCSSCGRINKELSLNDREWMCSCGEVIDRDINAAINIKNFALKNHLSAEHRRKNWDELPTLVGVLTSETNNRKVKGSSLV